MAGDYSSDVAAVDAFLADGPKTFAGPPPEFGVSTFSRNGRYEVEGKWPIADSLGVVTAGQMRFVVRPGQSLGPSVSLIVGNRKVVRLDFVSSGDCESNPLWASKLGLPPLVCGPHLHTWEHNRIGILAQRGWELPCREPLPPQIRRFSQAFPWLADRLNLVLTPDQRQFDLPQQLL